jgi:hypothetical protein
MGQIFLSLLNFLQVTVLFRFQILVIILGKNIELIICFRFVFFASFHQTVLNDLDHFVFAVKDVMFFARFKLVFPNIFEHGRQKFLKFFVPFSDRSSPQNLSYLFFFVFVINV